ncbi:hypothetical protein C8R45DRAFT_1213320 [Mycena sanguinolenta]|nr:hypothetical protein C8R45DRAFT_1213320 [Mycena sanguinolenta]
MSTAQETTISTPELLEHTLAYLSMGDLLVVSPLVSKAWQTITLSPVALFFEPDPASTELVQNPLLVELFAPFFSLGGNDPWCWSGTKQALEAMPRASRPGAFRRADASWRRMLVTQPSTQNLVVAYKRHTMIGNYVRYTWVSSTMSQCVSSMEAHRSAHIGMSRTMITVLMMALPSKSGKRCRACHDFLTSDLTAKAEYKSTSTLEKACMWVGIDMTLRTFSKFRRRKKRMSLGLTACESDAKFIFSRRSLCSNYL